MLYILSFYTANYYWKYQSLMLPTLSGNQRINSLYACKNWYIQKIGRAHV